MRRLINCPTCSPSDKTTRNIWDVSTLYRERKCRFCGTVVPMRAQNKAVIARREAEYLKFEALLAELSAMSEA
jgi:uncharacterized Zn finger protein